MKLLFFIESMAGGGAERVMSVLVNTLVQKGHEVHLAYDDLRQKSCYPLDPRIAVHTLHFTGGRLDKLQVIRRIAFAVDPQIVVSSLFGLNVNVIAALLFSRYPVVACEHIRFLSLRESSLKHYIFRYHINKLATRVVLLTQRDYDFIGNRLRNKVVIPNPIAFGPADPETVSGRPKALLACGSLDRHFHKGFDTLIRVWSRIAPAHPDWTLDILGGGSEENTRLLEQWIREGGVQEQTRLLGFSTRAAQVMREHAVFVLSSRFEGLPMVLLESMSQGCCCVSFDCESGPREAITPGVDGLLVKDQDEEQMCRQLERVMEDGQLREKMGAMAIETSVRFQPENIILSWEKLFQDILAGKKTDSRQSGR